MEIKAWYIYVTKSWTLDILTSFISPKDANALLILKSIEKISFELIQKNIKTLLRTFFSLQTPYKIEHSINYNYISLLGNWSCFKRKDYYVTIQKEMYLPKVVKQSLKLITLSFYPIYKYVFIISYVQTYIIFIWIVA